SNYENHDRSAAAGPAGRQPDPRRGLQGPRPPEPPAGVLLPGARGEGDVRGGNPGGRGDPGADPVPSSGCAPSRRAGGESQGRAVHLLFRAARGGDGARAPAHRLLLEENAMSAKVHMHMHVSDLAKSRAFYEKFLGEGPVKVKTGYVKFLPG